MFIADAQVHIWQANTPERPWREGSKATRPPLEADELLREMDQAGVHRAILVPPVLEADRNDLVLAAARQYPDRFAAMGRLNLEVSGAREKIATWRLQPGMLGLRFSFQRAWVAPLLAGDRIAWLWEEAEKARVPITMLVTPEMLNIVGEVARRHPLLKLTLDHLGCPIDTKDEEAFAHLDQLLLLSQHPNIAVKASALPLYTADSYPYRRLEPHLRAVYDCFGPRRIFWGSDLSRLNCSYVQCVTMFTEEMHWLSAEDLEWIMGRGFCEWLGWGRAAKL